MFLDKIYTVLPGNGPAYQGGGLNVALKLADVLSTEICVEVVYYKESVNGYRSLDDAVNDSTERCAFLITWGPDIDVLFRILKGNHIIYFAQSSGWNIHVPSDVPIFCVSRDIMSYWANKNPFNPLYVVNPTIDVEPFNGEDRDIDVLFIERKSTNYLKKALVPALRKECKVKTISNFIKRPEMIKQLRRSKVYIYSSREHGHRGHQWTEGFGLQPLEAVLCGCTVFSNLHGGLSDHMDPGINMQQIEVFSLEYDMRRILDSVNNFNIKDINYLNEIACTYSEDELIRRVRNHLSEISDYFHYCRGTQQVMTQKFMKIKMCHKIWMARAWFRNLMGWM